MTTVTLDPEVAMAFEACPPPRVGFGNIARARTEWRDYVRRSMATVSVPVVDVHDESAVDPASGRRVPLRVYRPESRNTAALLYFHGGAFTLGDLDMEDLLCRRVSVAAGCPVVSVDYRLVPEFSFPAQLEDAVLAFDWMVERAPALGVAATRIAVGGCSAGATIAASLAHHLADRSGIRPSLQVLLSPVLDASLSSPSMLAALPGVRRHLRGMWKSYAGESDVGEASPLARAEWHGLAPAYLAVGELDELRDETRTYAERLRAAGVDSVVHVWPGAPHAFELFAPGASISRQSAAEIARVLVDGLRGLPT